MEVKCCRNCKHDTPGDYDKFCKYCFMNGHKNWEEKDKEQEGKTMAKMSIRIILKSGVEFTVKCDSFTINKNGLGQTTGYDIQGITENKPVYLDFEQVAAIVRTYSDEAN